MKRHDYIVGDFVLARYSVDAQWYKGVIVSSTNSSHEVSAGPCQRSVIYPEILIFLKYV